MLTYSTAKKKEEEVDKVPSSHILGVYTPILIMRAMVSVVRITLIFFSPLFLPFFFKMESIHTAAYRAVLVL